MKRMFSFVLLAFFAMQSVALAASPDVAGSARPRPARVTQADGESRSLGVIIKTRDTESAPLVAKLLAGVHDTSVGSAGRAGTLLMGTPFTHTAEQFAVQLMVEAPGLAYAEPNYVRHINAYTPPTDPDFNNTEIWSTGVGYYLGAKHWWQTAMEAPGAWAIGQGDTYPVHGAASDVKVAVLDTGFFLSHPEFSAGTVVAGIDECATYNPITDVVTTDLGVAPDVTDDIDFQSHGTATAAAIGAEVNGTGTVGSGWNPSVVCYKVAGPSVAAGYGYELGELVILDSAIANGIYDATDAGCKVISMSLSGPDPSTTLQDAITYAHNHGVVVCASVGNEGAALVTYPAACTYATAVGAVERSGGSVSENGTLVRASFSNYGAGVVDLTAPGEMFWTAYKPGVVGYSGGVAGYDFLSGTSFSTPAVAGAIAYMWRAMPSLSDAEIVSLMQSTAVDLGSAGRDDLFGYGLVDMEAAYQQLISANPTLAKPVIAGGPYVKSGSSMSWSAVTGYSVGYQVSVDGVLKTTQAGTSYTLPAMSDGTHVLSVLPASVRNWNSSSLATKTLTWDSTAPLVGNFSATSQTVTWSVTDATPCTVQAYFDSQPPAALGANTLSISSLTSGIHTVHVSATDSVGNSSDWTTWTFSVDGPPILQSIVVTDSLSATMSWAPVAGAVAYEYQIDGLGVVSTTATSVEITGLTGGVVGFRARSVLDGGGTTDWATATVTNNLVDPGRPEIHAPARVYSPSVVATWQATADARSYECRVDGGSSTSTVATSVTLPVSGVGEHIIEVRALNNFRQSDWAAITTEYRPRIPVTLTLSASAAKLVYPSAAVRLTGSISATSVPVRVQSSADGVSWFEVATVLVGAASPATVLAIAAPIRSMKYRLVFDETVDLAAATSNVVSVAYAPRLTTPSTPSRVKRKAKFYTYSYASAPAANGSAVMTFKFERYQRSGKRYKWVVRKSVSTKGTVYSASSMRYRVRTYMSYTGKWRVKAYYSGAPMYTTATSGYRYFRVK